MSAKLTTEQFVSKVSRIHPTLDFSHDTYVATLKPFKTICKVCNHVWYPMPHDLVTKRGCPVCRHTKCSQTLIYRKSLIFLQRVQSIHTDLDFSQGIYTGVNNQFKTICKVCKHIWQPRARSLLDKKGCPKCKSSKGELAIEQFLKEHNINYETQKRFRNCRGKKNPLPFDFYLPDHNICIEFDGRQHTDTKSKYYSINLIHNDQIKNKYCIDNNIKLIRISYKEL